MQSEIRYGFIGQPSSSSWSLAPKRTTLRGTRRHRSKLVSEGGCREKQVLLPASPTSVRSERSAAEVSERASRGKQPPKLSVAAQTVPIHTADTHAYSHNLSLDLCFVRSKLLHEIHSFAFHGAPWGLNPKSWMLPLRARPKEAFTVLLLIANPDLGAQIKISDLITLIV